MSYELHFDSNDVEKLYNYTDDLMTIHWQLTKVLQDRELSVGVQVLMTEVAIRTLFKCDLLETPTHLSAKEKMSKYAVKYVGEINEIYRDAHLKAIKEFHRCWGVLPNSALDDYRSVGVKPLSLSVDFIEEALANPTAIDTPIDVPLITSVYQLHQAEPGSNKKPFYVRTATEYVQDRVYWLLSHLPEGAIEVEYRGNECAFRVNEASKDAFVYEDKLHIPMGDRSIEWIGSIQWFTDEEITSMYDEVKNAQSR
jgi:hypothetical protein